MHESATSLTRPAQSPMARMVAVAKEESYEQNVGNEE
jgi:hypothetical protein